MTWYPVPGLPPLPERVDRGHARAIVRGPSTVAEVLERGRLAMLAEDDAEMGAATRLIGSALPINRPRRLIDVLLRRKTWR